MSQYSFIIGRIVEAGSADGVDPLPSAGRVRFTPINPAGDDITTNASTVAPIGRDGIIGRGGCCGVWLAVGRYEASFELRRGEVDYFQFDLGPGYTRDSPFNLANARVVPPNGQLPTPGGTTPPLSSAALEAHIHSLNPHPTYDTVEDLSVLFENRLV